MGFWILAITAAVVTIAIIGRAMLATGDSAEATAAFDVQVYRDQLTELDRDLTRGVIGNEEAERARVEISRRLLDADRKAQAGSTTHGAPKGLTLAALTGSGALILGGGIWLYSDLGAVLDAPVSDTIPLPQVYPDLPLESRFEAAREIRETRMSQAEAEARQPAWPGPPPEAPQDYIDLVAQLRTAVQTRPDDVQGQMLLASHETALNNYVAAHKAMAQVLALKGDGATGEEYAQYVDLLVLAAGAYVSPEAEAAINAALGKNPRDPVARYYSGLMFAQTGRPDIAFRFWRDLLETSAPSDPWVAPIRGQIESLAAMAGVDYTPRMPAAPAPGLAGPSAGDMAAAADMSAEDRADMVAGMVSRLMQRLASQGGSAQEWAQLIKALGVQGDTARAQAIFDEARATFAAHPADLATVTEAAAEAGLDTGTDAGTDTGPATGPATGTGTTGAPTAGPDAGDVAAAAEMTDAERNAMIDGMVTRLADRIGTQGGTPAEWAQLIGAYGVMGETELATTAYGEARDTFADDPAALETLKAAATAAGVAE